MSDGLDVLSEPEAGSAYRPSARPAGRRTLAQTAARLRGPWWATWDALAAAGSMVLAHALSPLFGGAPLGSAVLRAATVHAVAFLAAGALLGLYEWTVWRGRRVLLLRALGAAVLAAGATLAIHYLIFYAPLGRRVSLAAVALSAPLVALPRYALWLFLRDRPRRVLFVGDSALQQRTRAVLEADPNRAYRVVGTWLPIEAGPTLVDHCARAGIDEVVLPGPSGELAPLIAPAVACLPLGCRVRTAPDFWEDVLRAVPVDDVTADWLLASGLDSSDHLSDALKRGMDIVLAGAALLAGAPVLGLIALAIRWSDGAPVLFRQARVGRYGRTFVMLKFRTMHSSAELDGARWAAQGDERVTSLGAILRRLRLDELPQLVNILRGEMSFVGPRPERPEFVVELEHQLPFYAWRHLIRPGLTGWAQINYPYAASVEDARRKLEFDLYYLRNFTLVGDLSIVLRTLALARQGSR